jgi:acetyl-CoA synthetase
VVFVTLKQGQKADDHTKAKLTEHIDREIGKFARPDQVRFADALPKTRSGKIMRRLLKARELGLPEGDTSTLEAM